MEQKSNCPFCSDTRQRFYERVTPTGTVYHCFNCNKSGFKPRADLSPKELINRFNSLSVIPFKSSNVSKVRLPFDYTTSIPKEGLQWFYKYGIMDDDIKRFGFGYSSKYNRVILPIFENEELIYYQARTLEKPSKDNPKYINVRQSGAKNVWFKAFFSDTKNLVVVEDILSACKISKVENVVSLLGSYIPDSFIKEVCQKFDKIYLWLDRDKLKESLKYAQKLRVLLNKQVVVIVKERDPKEYSTDEIKEILE